MMLFKFKDVTDVCFMFLSRFRTLSRLFLLVGHLHEFIVFFFFFSPFSNLSFPSFYVLTVNNRWVHLCLFNDRSRL